MTENRVDEYKVVAIATVKVNGGPFKMYKY